MSGAASSQVIGVADKSQVRWLNDYLRVTQDVGAGATARCIALRLMAPYCRDFFCEFDTSVQGWINHVRFADSWGLRRHVLRPFRIKPDDLRQKKSSAASRR